MPLPRRNFSPQGGGRRRPSSAHLPWLLALGAVAACDCDDSSTRNNGGDIQVLWNDGSEDLVTPPAAVTIDGIPGRAVVTSLQVKNIGNGVLKFLAEPAFFDPAGNRTNDFRLTEQFVTNCDETPRDAAKRSEFISGECAWFRFEYQPDADGLDAAVLRFVTDDPTQEGGILDVPLAGNAQTPDIQVCAFDGQTELGCSDNRTPSSIDSPFEVDFGISELGASTTRRLVVRSRGSRPLDVDGLTLDGDADYAVTPTTLVDTLVAGAERELTVTFTALSGSFRNGMLFINSNDPSESRFAVRLLGIGDGPALCTAIARAGQTCADSALRPSAEADFGAVGLGTTASRTLCLVSCGRKPLDLNTVVVEGGPIFGATLPTLPANLAIGARAEVPLTFAPPTPDAFTGRVVITSATGLSTITLKGSGIVSGCKLEGGSGVLDFGQVAVTASGRRQYAVSNTGTEDCIVDTAPEITAGAAVKFEVVGFPPFASIPPGGNVSFQLGYSPVDLTTPDEGELTIRYHSDGATPATGDVKIRLRGTPTAEPICTIVATPGTTSAFGRTLNYGQVRVNQEKQMSVTLQNTGSIQCTLGQGRLIAPPNSPFFPLPNDLPAFNIVQQPAALLQPGDITEAIIAFKPTEERAYGSPFNSTPIPLPGGGSFGVKFVVQTSDQTNHNGQSCSGFGSSGSLGCVGWDLAGTGVKSALHVLPPDVNFGLVTLGCRSREQIVTLYNVGAAELTVTGVTVDPLPVDQNNPIFRVVHPATDFKIPGGGQVQISIRYRPPDTGIHTATINIASDATNTSAGNPYTTVSLRGQGTTQSLVTDTFDQNSRPKSDVLFVVDNSGSMSEEQTALGNNAASFISTATALNTDFQIGVVTTDMDAGGESGRLQGSGAGKIIKPGPTAAQDFKRLVQAGTNGSADEKGLEAMFSALTDPLINDPATNGGFLRPDAKLAVVVISDEEDYSNGTAIFYTDFLRNLKGIHNASLVTFSAIVGDDPGGCSSGNGAADAGKRYIAVQQATGGKFRSICSQNWGQVAADLGLDAFGARNGFPLSRDADPNKPMSVTVNGTPSVQPAWSYDSQVNTVVFAPPPPPASATVTVTYEAACY